MISKNNIDFQIEGEHNVDQNYLSLLKASNPNIRIFPRIYLNTDEMENLQTLSTTQLLENIAKKIGNLVKKYDDLFDGIMFDSPLINYLNVLSFDFGTLLKFISEDLGDKGKDIILSFMAHDGRVNLKPAQIEKIFLLAHKILIQTYDYNAKGANEFPLSPIDWYKQNLEFYFNELSISGEAIKKKLMMGIPFYGYKIDYTAKSKEAIINNQYIDILNKHQPNIEWNNKYEECIIKLRENYSNTFLNVYYPCLKFIKARLTVAEDYGVGIFVWEGGQGLDYFYSLF